MEILVTDHGEIRSTMQHFKDIFLPWDIIKEIHKNYKGYTVESVDYKSYGNGDSIYKEKFKIKVSKDDESKILRFKK